MLSGKYSSRIINGTMGKNGPKNIIFPPRYCFSHFFFTIKSDAVAVIIEPILTASPETPTALPPTASRTGKSPKDMPKVSLPNALMRMLTFFTSFQNVINSC